MMGSGLLGAGVLALAAIGFTLMTAGVIGLAAIALLGIPAGAGLAALGTGLSVFGGTTPIAIIGIGLLGLLGLALIPVTYALSLLTPIMEAFGNIIVKVFQGMASLIPPAAAGIATLLDSITLSGVFALGLLGGALLSLGMASLFAAPGLFILSKMANSISEMAKGLSTVSSATESLTSNVFSSIDPLTRMVGPVRDLASAIMELGESLIFLGAFGSAGANLLSTLSEPLSFIIKSSTKSSQTGAVESESLSEYEMNMLKKMDVLIEEVKKNRDIYMDTEKVTSIVMKKSERMSKNIFGVTVA
jgi:hypothetical protein